MCVNVLHLKLEIKPVFEVTVTSISCMYWLKSKINAIIQNCGLWLAIADNVYSVLARTKSKGSMAFIIY
jgi:hypothetical protein